jgi:hypothetical protein
MIIALVALLWATLGGLSIARADEIRADLGAPGRSDTGAPHFVEWPFNPASPSMKFGAMTVALTNAGKIGSGLQAKVFKSGLDYGARLACDGVTIENGDGGGELEMIVSGLAPGPHTIVTYHNSLLGRDKPLSRFNLLVNDTLALSHLQPTFRATNDYDVTTACVRIMAETGGVVVLRFVPIGPAAVTNIMLNGFAIDTGDPAARAAKPSPADGDEHLNADRGSTSLQWTAPKSAVSHDLYFGTNAEAVAKADRKSLVFQGHTSLASHSVSNLISWNEYFWRVDEVDADGTVTHGELWRFRTRQQAFPTAEGYGRFARGGRGGRVIEVTNLNDSGPGSLRAAVEAEGPRTVVFAVSGLITLESRLVIRNPFITVAGQTAPGKGICLRQYNFGLGWTHDAIVRYIRVRPGNLSGQTLDGMGLAGCDHCIVDHCSISWTLDEAFSSRGAKNITLQRALISEALNEAGHKKYPAGTQHGYAASIGGNIGSFHHNLLAHCAGRNWSLAGGLDNSGAYAGRLDLRNNVVYNWKNRATDGGAHEVNFVANYYQPGPATKSFYALSAQYGGFPGTQQYFFEGNVMPGHFGLTNQTAGRNATTERGGKLPTDYSPWVDKPFFESHVRTHSAQESYENVLANVGCNFPALDEHDRRVVAEVRAGTFQFKGSKTGLPGLPDSQDDVGGWEEYPEVRRPADWDTDHDGMPDQWERAHGLNPHDATDGNKDLNGDGYTNLEKYLNSLVGEYSVRTTKASK